MSRITVDIYETGLGVQARASMRVRRWKWLKHPSVYTVAGATFPHGSDKQAVRDAVTFLLLSVSNEKLIPDNGEAVH